MADMALTRMRPKIAELRLALEGRFDDHHAVMLSLHLGHIDQLTATIDRLDAEVEREIAPFAEQVRRLCTIPGIGQRTAEVVIAEIGVDMGRFPTAKHLASWAGLCPGHHESAGKRRSGKARKGDAGAAGRAVRGGLVRGPHPRHLPRRPVPPVLSPHRQTQRRQSDLRRRPHHDRDHLARPRQPRPTTTNSAATTSTDDDTTAETRRHVAALQRLGHHVTLTPAA